MQSAHYAAALGNVLAPGPSKTHAVSAAQHLPLPPIAAGFLIVMTAVIVLAGAWRLIPGGPRVIGKSRD